MQYVPRDQLYLWWVENPRVPVYVGDLSLLASARGVSLRYSPSWLADGFALSEDLPLVPDEHLPVARDAAAGVVDDARPDRWGERVIRVIDRPPRLSLLEYLYFAGDDRFGALGVSTSATEYVPRRLGPLPRLPDVDTIQELVWKVLAREKIPEEQHRLISPGGTMGGARPKAIVEIEGEPWVVKFSAGDPTDVPLIEHACMTLAREAGIRVATTQPIPSIGGHAVAVRRFDRTTGGRRVHAMSTLVALRAAGEDMGYPELAQLLRRRGVVDDGVNERQMQELFRRMVFNILVDNTDDHEKNHVLLDDTQLVELSLAFDVLPSGQALGVQQMRVGDQMNDSTLDNAMSECSLFALTVDLAAEEIRRVIQVVDRWKQHFTAAGVTQTDLELLAEQIDRPFLLYQRREF